MVGKVGVEEKNNRRAYSLLSATVCCQCLICISSGLAHAGLEENGVPGTVGYRGSMR